ncbi:hypothetical protein [uncultured Succiniclasticum sp.]|nr:hypothetical protein [uncultured Succiniclasticum sp.]
MTVLQAAPVGEAACIPLPRSWAGVAEEREENAAVREYRYAKTGRF